MSRLEGIRGVVFDFGNTLIPFGQRQMDFVSGRLVSFLVTEIPGARVGAARESLQETLRELHRARMATLEESDPRDVFRRTFPSLGGTLDEEAQLARGLEVYRRAFLDSVEPAPGMEETLSALGDLGYRIGLLSNYSLAPAIHDALELLGIRGRFDSVVVSGDLGILKPHPKIFAASAEGVGLDPGEILFVGDNPRLDIAGAAGAGMTTAWITGHRAGRYVFDRPDESDAEVEPDLVCDRLCDLLTHLGR